MTKNVVEGDYAILSTGDGGTFNSRQPDGSPPSESFPLAIDLTTAGRAGFYMDYSELVIDGAHTFYICRTHGTTGAVSVSYQTSGDTHSTKSGVINWADGEADIFAVEVPVTAGNLTTHDGLGLGDHRIVMTLSSPTGGMVLHHGANTVATGVIDNSSMIADDTNAVFFDVAAGGGGSGTSASPYDNPYDAITNVGSKRYIYGKGTVIPDGTNTANPNGGGGFADCIIVKISRAGESTRCYIQAWPGNTLTIDGTARTAFGFYADGGMDYVTYTNIAFTNLDCSAAQFCEGGGVMNWKSASSGIAMEGCTGDNINGSTNTGLFGGQHVDGVRQWRCTANNIQVNGSNTHQNAGGVLLYYDCDAVSVQRCEASNAGTGMYWKRPAAGEITAVARFNYFHDVQIGIDIGFGAASNNQNFGIIQANLFKTINAYYAVWDRGESATADGYMWMVGNVFDDADASSNGCIQIKDTYSYMIFNNIFVNSGRVWAVQGTKASNSDPTRDVITYADYNQTYNIANATEYRYLGIYYADAAAVATATSNFICANDAVGDPLFTNPATIDYTLQGGSPSLTNGVGGTEQGLYFTGAEVIGA